jgi:hypothetical protein
MKQMKSLKSEICTDASVFNVVYPENAIVGLKTILLVPVTVKCSHF